MKAAKDALGIIIPLCFVAAVILMPKILLSIDSFKPTNMVQDFSTGTKVIFSSVVKRTLPFDPTALSGVYDVRIDPDDAGREAQDLRLVFNIQSQNGETIPFEVSMVDANGKSFKAQTTCAHLGSSPASIDFIFTCQASFDAFEFQGNLSSGNLQGSYKETIDIIGFSGGPCCYPGRFSGTKTF